ncbi:DNA polymerase [Paramuricea clavata]|uniref:DNA-directed DNA polymerase n=1 Tax=Paramuricea clavata TaxID=317549 RepID=A0A6S7H835_PARCT|nr:DNA polymerase [Paramuricea clavata]
MKDFFDNFEISEPLEPRHAFFGGRTNATCLYYDVQPEEKIRYVDFCSLYPCDYFGLVKCSVLPPRALYHPVLHYRTQDKFMFPSCRTCADNLQQELCYHSDAERTLLGTWVTLELEKALEKGYELMKVDKVWHFPEHTHGLFKDYIDTFLKIKQEVEFHHMCDIVTSLVSYYSFPPYRRVAFLRNVTPTRRRGSTSLTTPQKKVFSWIQDKL